MKIYSLFFIIFIFFILFFIIHLIHFYFFEVDVVLYSTFFDFIITLIVILTFMRFFNVLNLTEKSLTFALLTTFGIIYSLAIPTIIDRSLSIYILEKIQQRGGGVLKNSLEKIFIDEYMKEHQLMEIRLTEQLKSGTVYIEKDCIKLTKKGDLIAKFSKFYRANFLPKNRLILDEYSDQLINLFKDNEKNIDYKC